MNDDKNYLGRLLALALIAGAAYGVRAVARGYYDCGLSGRCPLGQSSLIGVPPAPEKAAPVEEIPAAKALPAKADSDANPGEDDEATLERKAPVVPPSPSGKTK